MGLFSNNVNEHHRNYPFRPPMRRVLDEGTDLPLYWRFVKAYVWPRKWSLLLCIFFIAINSTSTYLMGFYERMVVDDIIAVSADSGAKQSEKG
ncbi:MAG: hypothetical protein IJS15_15580, partial [Victivallales bacterium]|nr:hypothetical protein [Victivallales bacterium]